MPNKVRFGLSNVAVAFQKDDGQFDTPTRIPGAVTITMDAEGDQSVFYADNSAYYTVNSNAGYTGELTMALIPDEIKAKMLGWKIDKNGALVEVSDGFPKAFALLFQINGDSVHRYNLFYNVMANRPSEEHNTTEDSAEPTTEAMPFTATPLVIDNEKVTKLSVEINETNQEIVEGFYDKVYLPDFTSSYKAPVVSMPAK